RLVGPFERVSKIMNLIVVVLILATQFSMLTEIRLAAFAGMLALLGASLLAGWLAARPDRAVRTSLAITTARPNAGVALVLATAGFADPPAVTAVLAYAIVSVFGTLAVAVWLGRRTATPERARAWGAARSKSPAPPTLQSGSPGTRITPPRGGAPRRVK